MADSNRTPWRFSLPFLPDREIGLGDAISYLTSSVGIKPCTACQQRAERLNQMLILQGRNRRRRNSYFYPDEM